MNLHITESRIFSFISILLRNYFLRLLLGFFVTNLNLTLLAAGAITCDPSIKPDEQNLLAYRFRQERCEGIYIKEVAGSALYIGSLTQGLDKIDIATKKDLLLKWTSPDKADVYLRAYGLRRRLYYRMDTFQVLGSSQFRWTTSILNALGIQSRDLGVIGWYRQRIGKENRDIYIPIKVSEQETEPDINSYLLTVQPGIEFKEIYLSVASIDSEGKPINYIQNEVPLKYGFYPPHRRIDIHLNLQATGLYQVEIGAEQKEGGTTTLEFLLFHSTH